MLLVPSGPAPMKRPSVLHRRVLNAAGELERKESTDRYGRTERKGSVRRSVHARRGGQARWHWLAMTNTRAHTGQEGLCLSRNPPASLQELLHRERYCVRVSDERPFYGRFQFRITVRILTDAIFYPENCLNPSSTCPAATYTGRRRSRRPGTAV